MKKICLLICLVSFGTMICSAQNYTPLELCQRILSQGPMPDIKKYCTGDFKGHPNGSDFPPALKKVFTLLTQNDTTAVVNVTLSDSTGKALDTYLHLVKDSVWKVSAFRALSLTGIIEQVHEALAALGPKQVDSVIVSRHTLKRDYRLFKSREDYSYKLGNTGLIIAADQTLITHFNKNKTEFEAIKNQLNLMGIKKSPSGVRGMKNIAAISTRLRRIFISNVSPDFEEKSNSLNFLVGGMVDNSVGYFYIPDSKDVPEMSSENFIMIRPLGDGWYLYKTT